MSITKQRFMISPIATADNITASTQGYGTIAGAKKTGTGSAVMIPTGSYTGQNDKLYTIQVDYAGTGEIGSSTIRWKTSDTTPGTWEATGVATTSTPVALGSEGFNAQFIAGTGADFVLNDKWQAWAYASHGVGNLFVSDRDKYWKGADSTTTVDLVIDCGTATLINTLILADHNLSATAVVTFQGNATDAWTSPTYSNVVLNGDNQDPAVDYLSQTFRYFRVLIVDTSNTDGFISVGKLYVGTYTELARVGVNVDWGSLRGNARTVIRNVSKAGKARGYTYSDGEEFDTAYTLLSDADEATLRSIYDYTYKTGRNIYGTNKSIWVHYWNDDDDSAFLCENTTTKYERKLSSYGLNGATITWRQEVMTRVI